MKQPTSHILQELSDDTLRGIVIDGPRTLTPENAKATIELRHSQGNLTVARSGVNAAWSNVGVGICIGILTALLVWFTWVELTQPKTVQSVVLADATSARH